MKIALITLFPEMFEALTDYGVSGRAVNQGLLEISSFNPRITPMTCTQQLMIAPMVVVPAWSL